MDSSSGVTPARKSGSREKSKRIDTSDISEERGPLEKCVTETSGHSVSNNGGVPLFSQTFLDTVVTFKATPTLARAKKPKPDLDLGVKPLETTVQKTLDYKMATDYSKLPWVTSTVTRPTTSSSMAWDAVGQCSADGVQIDIGDKVGRDVNHNLPIHIDQYGNVVQVHVDVTQPLGQQDLGPQGHEPMFTQPVQDVTQTPTMDLLKANPFIQRRMCLCAGSLDENRTGAR